MEELQRRDWLSPLVVGRHADPIDGGAAFDWHAHLTVEINPNHAVEIAGYLRDIFGVARVWISTEEEDSGVRDLVATACYPAAKLANRGFDDIADEHLLEFFAQSSGLRRIEVAGPVRAARRARRGSQPSEVSACRGPEAALAAIVAEADEMLPEVNDADERGPDTETEREEGDAKPVGDAGEEKAHRAPRLLRVHLAYLGLGLRWVARVADYAGWDDLRARYDLSWGIAEAKAMAAQAAHLLSLNPVIPESNMDESDFESLADWNDPAGKRSASGDDAAAGGMHRANLRRR